jgi:nitronate monooxygenase
VFTRAVKESGVAVPPYPLQNALTRPMRTAAARIGDAERLSLWAGQGIRLVRRLPAAELIERLVREEQEALRRLDIQADARASASDGRA